MTLPKTLVQRLSAEADSLSNPPDDALIALLRECNANGDALAYFSKYNFMAEMDMICLEDARDNLESMQSTAPACEVWQHGFIPFARDFEDRIYCFNQNDRDAKGNSKIVRFASSFGKKPTAKKITSSSQTIAPSLAEFLELYLDSKIDSI